MSADPTALPDDLQEMLVSTLGRKGVAGVLADWIDERSPHWTAFTEALRLSRPIPSKEEFNCGPFHYRIVAEWVTFAAAEYFGPARATSRVGVVVTVFRFTPGRQQQWSRLIPSDVLPDGLFERLLAELQPRKSATTRGKTAARPKKLK